MKIFAQSKGVLLKDRVDKKNITRRQFMRIASLGSVCFLGSPTRLPITLLEERVTKPSPIVVPKIKILGIGGAGCHAVEYMLKSSPKELEFIVAGMDWMLEQNACPTKILLHREKGKGFVCGPNPELGYLAALESREIIRQYLEGSDLVLIVAGMGGGTGAGGAPVAAQIAKEFGALVIAVVTKPFNFETKIRSKMAEEGVQRLKSWADSIVLIPNQAIVDIFSKNIYLIEAFKKSIEYLSLPVKALAEMALHPGLSISFEDIKTVLSGAGICRMGISTGRGNGLLGAVEEAIHSPFLMDIPLRREKKFLICHLSVPSNARIWEVNEAATQALRMIGEDIDPFIYYVSVKEGEPTAVLITAGAEKI
jgi:cell division protein FtsZ